MGMGDHVPEFMLVELRPALASIARDAREAPRQPAEAAETGPDAARVVNRITVPEHDADPARLALERMLAARPPAAGGGGTVAS